MCCNILAFFPDEKDEPNWIFPFASNSFVIVINSVFCGWRWWWAISLLYCSHKCHTVGTIACAYHKVELSHSQGRIHPWLSVVVVFNNELQVDHINWQNEVSVWLSIEFSEQTPYSINIHSSCLCTKCNILDVTINSTPFIAGIDTKHSSNMRSLKINFPEHKKIKHYVIFCLIITKSKQLLRWWHYVEYTWWSCYECYKNIKNDMT